MHIKDAHPIPQGESLQVMVSYGPLGLVRATTRELGYDGMTVDTGNITLGEQAEVEISFTHKLHDEYITHRISGTVSESSPGHARLAFSSYARTTYQALRELIENTVQHPGTHPLVCALPELWRTRKIPSPSPRLLLGNPL